MRDHWRAVFTAQRSCLERKKERKRETTENNVQEPEIPGGKRSIGQDVVLLCNYKDF